MAFTAGDPGEQSAADAAQSAAVDAATSGGRDFGSDSGPQSGPNVGGKDFGQNVQSRPQGPAFGGMDMSPGRARSMFGTTYGTQLGGIDQARFNQMRGITATNPFGSDNIFSKYLGIDPKNIDYSDNIPEAARLSIANNQFSKFVNPQNRPGMPGYNPAYATAEEGKLRAGVQSEDYMTAYGPVMEQARKQSTGEMIARGLFGLTPLGPIASMLGTQEYGLPGMPGFDSFDPNNPQQGGGLLGAMLGGLNPTQAKEAITEFFSAPVAAPTKVGIESLTPASYETRADIIGRKSQHPLTGETTRKTVPGQRISTVSTTGGIDAATAKKADEIFGPSSLSYDFYTDPQAGGTYPSAMAGEQLAMGFKGLESGYSQQVYDELRDYIETGDPFVQPGNENMYGTDIPGVFDQDYNRNLGPVSGLPAGSFDVAGSGGRTYQSGYQGQSGLYSPGGKGQTYYGGTQENRLFDDAATTAKEALDRFYGFVTG
jgi:hypothetical protein